MANNEERIKAFFNDEEKVKALASDEEFMKKVLSGEVTPEAYKKEFEKFGLNLTLEEAEEIFESTKKAMSITDEKLDEVDLEDVMGGSASGVVGGLLAGGAVGTGLASLVYFAAGAGLNHEEYLKRGAKLAFAAAAMGVSSGIILSHSSTGTGHSTSASTYPTYGNSGVSYPTAPSHY